MVVALLLPVVLLLLACLLDRFERSMISLPPAGARTPVPRPAPVDAPDAPVAAVVPLRRGPELDAATLRLRRAS